MERDGGRGVGKEGKRGREGRETLIRGRMVIEAVGGAGVKMEGRWDGR